MEELKDENQGVYTAKEKELLELVTTRRIQMIEANFKTGAPESTGEQRVTNEILTALANDVHTAAANRLKHEADQNDAAIKQRMAALLTEKANRRAKQADRPADAVIEVADDLIGKPDFVPGELEIDAPAVTYDEIMKD